MSMRVILYQLGVMISGLAGLMLIPMLVGLIDDKSASWQPFFFSALLTGTLGGSIALACRTSQAVESLSIRSGFVLVPMASLFLALLAALPFLFAPWSLAPVDAIFEAIAGVTTTGTTMLTGLDHYPAALLVWRSLLQWIGGLGAIILSLSVLPALRVGGMQHFRLHSDVETQQAMPRIRILLRQLLLLYLGLTLLCTLAYRLVGLPLFEATNYAMTTLATGGFLPSDFPFGRFDPSIYYGPDDWWINETWSSDIQDTDVYSTAAMQYVMMPFMLAGAIPFFLYLELFRRRFRTCFQDPQLRLFFVLILGAATVLFFDLWWRNQYPWDEAIRQGLFNTVAVLSTTGSHSSGSENLSPFAVVILFGLMFIGGCAGSTAGGIRIFRIQVAALAAWRQLHFQFQPSGVYPLRYGGYPLHDHVIQGVGGFFLLFSLSMALLAIGLGAAGCDFQTSIEFAVSALSNIGQGNSAQDFSMTAKIMLCAGMLIGRLEFFMVFVLVSPLLWYR